MSEATTFFFISAFKRKPICLNNPGFVKSAHVKNFVKWIMDKWKKNPEISIVNYLDTANKLHKRKGLLPCNDVLMLVHPFLYARLKNGRIMLWQCPSVCPSVRPFVRVFRTFFQHALRYQFETWYMHSVGGTTCRVWVSSQLSHFDLVYSQK